MRNLIILFFVLAPFISMANSPDYSIDLNKIDREITQAKEVNYQDFSFSADLQIEQSAAPNQASVKNATTAFVLGIFLGTFGVHRLYLGTTIGVFIVYVITQGGCGVLYTVDNILLLVALLNNDSIDTYIDNPHLFMWM